MADYIFLFSCICFLFSFSLPARQFAEPQVINMSILRSEIKSIAFIFFNLMKLFSGVFLK